jgi:uncharacterized delta-60 repeat protein
VETLESRRLLSAGDLDPTFGAGGLVTTDFPGSAADRPRQIALQADGKLLEVAWHSGFGVGEPTLSVTRFNTDGSLDTGFGEQGIRLIDFPGRGEFFGSIALAPGGKIAVATWSFFPTTDILGEDSDVSVALLNSDGSFDTNFDSDGMKVFDVGQAAGGLSAAKTSDVVFDVAVGPDGKIVTAGGVTINKQTRVALTRLNLDGSLDTTFGTGGVVTTPWANYSGGANSVAVDDQGRILALAQTGIPGTNGRVTDYDFGVGRYNPDGSLDTTFDGDGFAITKFSTASDTPTSIEVAPDGKIVAAGGTPGPANNGDIAVARFNDDGSPDTSFDGDGMVTVGLTGRTSTGGVVPTKETAVGLAVQSDGAILLSGQNTSGAGVTFVGETFLLRLDPAGTLDSGFGDNGKVVSADLDEGAGVAVSPDDGAIFLGGVMTTPLGGFEDFAASRYDSAGNLDTSYGNSGVAVADFIGSGFSQAAGAAVQADGKIVVGGLTIVSNANLRDLAFARYNPNGSLDPSFGNGGLVQVDLGTPGVNTERVSALAIDAGGRIVFAGNITDPDTQKDKILVGRLNPDGSLDSSFASGGVLIVGAFGGNATSNDTARDVLVQADGRIVVVGDYSPAAGNREFAALRLEDNGDFDATFGPGGSGMFHTPVGGADSQANAIVLVPDQFARGEDLVLAGRALVGGNNQFALVRLDRGGTLDPLFGASGSVTTAMGSSNASANDVALDAQGYLVAGGYARVTSPTNQGDNFALARFAPDGTLDAGFGTGGKVLTDFTLSTDQINSLLVLPDRSVVAAGSALAPEPPTASGSLSNFALAKYTAAGALDPSFGNGGKVTTDFAPGVFPSAPTASRDVATKLLAYGGDRVVAVGNAIMPRTGPDFALARYTLTADAPARVTGRGVFYNGSAYDNNGAAVNDQDLLALATDKQALLPGQAARFENVTSYSRGINGLYVRLSRADLQSIRPADFVFEVGDGATGGTWTGAPAPAAFHAGPASTGDATEVLLSWADGAIKNQWIRVTVLANADTKLAAPDVFYFGNLIGDTGDGATTFRVNAIDLGGVKRELNHTSTITGHYDLNRDGRINALDLGAVKANLNRSLTSTAPSAAGAPAPVATAGSFTVLKPSRVWDEGEPNPLA